MGIRRRGGAIAFAVALTVVAGGAPGAAATGARQDPLLELAAQAPGVDPGGTFTLAVVVDGVPAGGELRVVVHDRVRSRTELGASSDGEGLRRSLHTVTTPLTELAAAADGTRQVTIPLTSGTPAGRAVVEPGVYPVAVDLLDGSRSLGRFVTHLVLRPPPSASTPPLAVAVLVAVGGPPRPAGEPPLGPEDIAASMALVDALATAPDVAATLGLTPDTIARLAEADTPDAAALVEGLRSAAGARPTVALPYVATSPDALDEAGLADELARQLDRGAATLADVLGSAPTQATWLAGPDLGGDGLQLLTALGVRQMVLSPAQVERVTDGVLSPARPFDVAPPRPERGRDEDDDGDRGDRDDDEEDTVEALLTDPRLQAALAGGDEPALVASHVLAELAALWFEQPGTPRAVVVPIDPEVEAGAVRGVLEGLRASALFRPVAIDDAFGEAAPLLDRAGDTLRRALDPEDPEPITDAVADDIRELRDLQPSVEAMVGPASETLAALDAHLLRATAADLRTADRRVEVDAAEGVVEDLADAIGTPETVTITLTAREGTVPLTIRNETGDRVEVQVRLRSPKLELPGGDTFSLTLAEPSNRLDIPVRTRASGSFPFDVEVTSPDGRVALASTRYSVRSTAVSGVGLFLSVGAGLFLVVWWARHWREHRRATKLVGPESEGG